MEIGVTLDIVDVESGKAVPTRLLAEQAKRAENLGFASIWTNDHFWWMEYNGHRLGGHEPFTSLSYIAAHTERVSLGTLVVCNSFRHPAQLAREAITVADMSDGRLILGLGSGWNLPEYQALGIPTDHLTSRLEESLQIVTRLIQNGRTTFHGRFYDVDDVLVQSVDKRPLVWLGTDRPRTLAMAARYADGWNWTGPRTPNTVDEFRALSSTFNDTLLAEGRRRDDVVVSANIFLLLAEDEAGREAVAQRCERMLGTRPSERVVIATISELPEIVKNCEADGVDHLVLSLSPVPMSVFNSAQMEWAADVLALNG